MIPGDSAAPDIIKECRSHLRPAVVVFFVGGVTYGEVATLRLLGKLLSTGCVECRKGDDRGDHPDDQRGLADRGPAGKEKFMIASLESSSDVGVAMDRPVQLDHVEVLLSLRLLQFLFVFRQLVPDPVIQMPVAEVIVVVLPLVHCAAQQKDPRHAPEEYPRPSRNCALHKTENGGSEVIGIHLLGISTEFDGL